VSDGVQSPTMYMLKYASRQCLGGKGWPWYLIENFELGKGKQCSGDLKKQ
jgi:hypothetical protein